jgi:hypothetical protein
VLPIAVYAGGNLTAGVDDGDEAVQSVTFTPPRDGILIVDSTVVVVEATPGDGVVCSITTGDIVDVSHQQWWESSGGAGDHAQLAGTRGFDVARGAEFTANLVCAHVGSSGSSTIFDPTLTAIHIPGS